METYEIQGKDEYFQTMEEIPNFTTCTFTPPNAKNCKSDGAPTVFVGDDKGNVHAFNTSTQEFMARSSPPSEEKAIGCISFPLTPNPNLPCVKVVVGSESGVVHQYHVAKKSIKDNNYAVILPSNGEGEGDK